jgi:hypothetical protein
MLFVAMAGAGGRLSPRPCSGQYWRLRRYSERSADNSFKATINDAVIASGANNEVFRKFYTRFSQKS